MAKFLYVHTVDYCGYQSATESGKREWIRPVETMINMDDVSFVTLCKCDFFYQGEGDVSESELSERIPEITMKSGEKLYIWMPWGEFLAYLRKGGVLLDFSIFSWT